MGQFQNGQAGQSDKSLLILYKKVMSDIIETKNKPLYSELKSIKNNLAKHYIKTENKLKKIDKHLTNHVTGTEKKITAVVTAIKALNKKVDKLLKQKKAD